ncbi:hypothetical protein B1R47_25270 [Salmonella enterica subsp. enterica serovar Weltevreden]|uniref:DUF2919 family protein n=1 Tax=Salmonella enterica subsp. enterica serovar Weltevreden TaxID=57743 RepID=A0A5T4EMV0_SALET|nr:DUF2919 family protein [Salmonella enterica]ECE0326777.1 DUF2919 family protein [Salmonella enterica subsp. houtenae]ECE0559508.1 DUF2919 family protein [Salmonella enterica subsp. enterica serovar Richmond]EDQ2553433.1 DUF2919 family protein [Salmonella enterica subsp. enterica]EHA4049905.1 DUF2919 family protein [Salmonella enterica subsp. enterica serovar Farmingdale]EAB7627212.1 DUF2919 family protein [Salmonella enterica subsp. enterica serovar Weltevreden]
MKVLTPVSRQRYQADDYDEDGNLKAPMWFWVTLLWLLFPWWLTVIGMAQKSPLDITQILYPSLIDNVIGLLASAPALLIFLTYPIRGRYPQWGRQSYFILLGLGSLELIYQGGQLIASPIYANEWSNSLILSILCFNLAALLSIALSTRLHHIFVTNKL